MVRTLGQDGVVLDESSVRALLHERERCEAHVVFERPRIGQKAGAVRALRCPPIIEPQANESEGVPDDGVPGITPQSLFEPWPGQLPLPPTRSAKAPGSGPERIPWRPLGRAVVHGERLVVAMGELERVAKLHPRDRTSRSGVAGELLGLPTRLAEISLEAVHPNEETASGHVSGVVAQSLLEDGAGVGVALPIDEQRGLTQDVGLCRTCR